MNSIGSEYQEFRRGIFVCLAPHFCCKTCNRRRPVDSMRLPCRQTPISLSIPVVVMKNDEIKRIGIRNRIENGCDVNFEFTWARSTGIWRLFERIHRMRNLNMIVSVLSICWQFINKFVYSLADDNRVPNYMVKRNYIFN